MKSVLAASALALAGTLYVAPAHAIEMPGKVPVGVLDVVAFGPSPVLTTVASDNTSPMTHNGADWYNWMYGDEEDDAGSFSVMPTGDTADLNECGNFSNDIGICWHSRITNGEHVVYWGYNYNDVSNLHEDAGVYRALYTSDDPSYYPAGVIADVPVSDLDGWELCWLDDWDFDSTNTSTFDELTAACDGDYIAMAVAAEIGDEVASTPLADTGFDIAPSLGAGAVAVVAGASIVARRRRAF